VRFTDLMLAQWEAGEPDWRGQQECRFRWTRLRFEWGRWCYIVAPVEGMEDIVWWEWER
jgi:hypothetical protein